jgi:hypothetical protein
MQTPLLTNLIWVLMSVPAAGGVWNTCIGCSGGPRALRGSIFLKISTIWNNRWPYAIVACNRAHLATSEPPCSRRWADDAYLEFGRFPGSQKDNFSQNLNDREQPLALCNRRL